MITTVFIDIDDTLLDFNESAKEAIKIIMDKNNLRYTPVVFDTFLNINNMLWDKIEKGTLTKSELFEIRWNMIFNELGINFDGKIFEDIFRARLSDCAVPVPHAKELLEYLHRKYTVYAASNAILKQQEKRLSKAGMLKYIDKMFISDQLGFFKPSRDFFDVCFSQLPNLSVDKAIIIGDSATADINGGADYGLKTCWFNRSGMSHKGVKADYIVSSLDEIFDIL